MKFKLTLIVVGCLFQSSNLLSKIFIFSNFASLIREMTGLNENQNIQPERLFTEEEESSCRIPFDESSYSSQEMKTFTQLLHSDVTSHHRQSIAENFVYSAEECFFKIKPQEQFFISLIEEINKLDDPVYKCRSAARCVGRRSRNYTELELKKNAHIKTIFWSLKVFKAESEFLKLCLNTFNQANIDIEKTEHGALTSLRKEIGTICFMFDKLIDEFVSCFGKDRIDTFQTLKNELNGFKNLSKQLKEQIENLINQKKMLQEELDKKIQQQDEAIRLLDERIGQQDSQLREAKKESNKRWTSGQTFTAFFFLCALAASAASWCSKEPRIDILAKADSDTSSIADCLENSNLFESTA